MRLLLHLLLLACLSLFTVKETAAQSSAVSSAAAVTASGSAVAVSSSAAAVAASSAVPASNSTATTSSTGNSTASNSIANLPTSASYGNSVYGASAVFVTPTPSKSVSPLYRIDSSENVTFSWTFTNLLVRPVNLTLAAVAPNSVTYLISAMDGVATSATWALSNVPAASPLMMGMYQIQLYDQRGIVSTTYSPGWLSPVTSLTIAFYSAESYVTPTGTDYCPTCFYSSARRMSINLGPIGIAFGIASLTSVFILYGLMY